MRTEPIIPGATQVRVIPPNGLLPASIQSIATGTGGTTSGTVELTIQTLNIAAKSYSYMLDVAGFIGSCFCNVDKDAYSLRIRVDSTQKGLALFGTVGASLYRYAPAIPCITPTTIAANTACAVTITLQRASGTGALTIDGAGVLTATLYPQP
jgi:hypothetical protein